MERNKKLAKQVAEAALRILEEEGPENVSMRRIARELGITPMAIYYYYPDRQALLKSVTDAEFGKLLRFFEIRQRQTPRNQRLLMIMDGYLDYAFARPRVFDYVFSKNREGARQFPDGFRNRQSPTLNPIADAIAEGMQTGELKQDDVWEVAMELWAHAHGYVALYHAGRFNLTERQFRMLVRRSIRRLLDGLKTWGDSAQVS
ncbi:MAG TPA: WHG domain-containing protein [Acidobacteriaceae bacterium]|jgi:AcrR family transcriptional regulator|nr:WHG domain-containing protein [Acidobacteriaceae bacterium]